MCAGEACFVDALGGDRVVDVGDGGDARELLDLCAAEAGGVAGAVDALVVVADDRDGERREVGGTQELDAGVGVGPHDLHLVVGEPAGLVEDLRRYGELADVVDEQTEAELAHAVVEAVVAAAAAEVGPAVDAPGAAGDQQPEHGDLDAVAVRVVVEGAEVVQRERGVRAVEQVVDHRGRDLRERVHDGVRHPGAGAQGGAGGGERVAGRAVDLGAGLGRQRLGDVDRLAEVVLDPHRADAGAREQFGVARGQLDARAQQRSGAGRARDDVARQLDTIANLP